MKKFLMITTVLFMTSHLQAGTTLCSDAQQSIKYVKIEPDTGAMPYANQVDEAITVMTKSGPLTYRNISNGTMLKVEFSSTWSDENQLSFDPLDDKGFMTTIYSAKLTAVTSDRIKKMGVLIFDGFMICQNRTNVLVAGTNP